MPLRRLWAGMLTKDTSYSGTDSRIVLIVNENGIDKLHKTFLDDPSQEDQEKGQANLYEVDVATNNISPDHLNNSSVRVGIRGDDLWRPEHFVVWGEQLTNGAIIPLAIETGLTIVLSTDASEGNLSFPLRLVGLGNQDMPINRLLMLMTTASTEDSETDSPVTLQIISGGSLVVDFDLQEDTSQRNQDRGQANLYFVPVNSPFTKRSLNQGNISLRIRGGDAWLPASFFLFGLDRATERPQALVPLVHIRTWNLGKLSTDTGEGVPSVTLPQV